MNGEPNKCSRISSDDLERPDKVQGAESDGSSVASGHRPVRRDGFSLVEIVITIALLGTVVVGVVAAVQGSIRASMTARHSAQIQTVLLNAADRVNRVAEGLRFHERRRLRTALPAVRDGRRVAPVGRRTTPEKSPYASGTTYRRRRFRAARTSTPRAPGTRALARSTSPKPLRCNS